MTRRRADKLDPHSREARRVNGFKRMEIELPIADAKALDVFAAHHGLSRSKAILRLIRFGPPADPFEPEPEQETYRQRAKRVGFETVHDHVTKKEAEPGVVWDGVGWEPGDPE